MHPAPRHRSKRSTNGMSLSLLFVCTGNTCRSPMAVALARARGRDAASAGIAAQHGDGPTLYAARVLRTSRGLDLRDHTPRDVEEVDLSSVERVVAMTPTVASHLRREYDVPSDRLITWSIPDPYGGSLTDYRYCLEEIDTALTRLGVQ